MPPPPQSHDRSRAEAEAKRARDEAETAAVLEDFVKSFEDDGSSYSQYGAGGGRGGGGFGNGSGMRGGFAGRGAAGGGKRHSTPMAPANGSGRSSGPGSLGPMNMNMRGRSGPGSLGFEDRNRDRGISSGSGIGMGIARSSAAAMFSTSDDEDESTTSGRAGRLGTSAATSNLDAKAMDKAAAKPTIHLSNLPPGTSPAVIKALIPSTLSVDNVRFLPPPADPSSSTNRRSSAAIVTLAKETPGSDIDTAVHGLQNRYLGWGYYLSISRYLSSAAVASAVTTGLGSTSSTLPFGAKAIQAPGYTGPGGGLNRAPPPAPEQFHRGGFAPPSSFPSPGMPTGPRSRPPVQIPVSIPSNLKELKLIHRTIESLLSHGPEFEALLMSRPGVQRSEKWHWIWNPRSKGGVYYRWKLWDVITDAGAKRERTRSAYGLASSTASSAGGRIMPMVLFEGEAAWIPPEGKGKGSKKRGLPFEYTTRFEELVSDEDYDSSDEEDDDDEARRRREGAGSDAPTSALNPEDEGPSYLTPLHKAKLTHLLSRLPTSTGRLRKGDVARVTAFAIEHAGSGAEEIVDMAVRNVLRPFSWTRANPGLDDVVDAFRRDDAAFNVNVDGTSQQQQQKPDTSSSKLIALYLISDILSSSSTSGVRHAWRYRTLFETALSTHNIFSHLGRIEKELGWGKLRAEKWRRSVRSVLSLWDSWCVFGTEKMEGFHAGFEKPGLSKREKEIESQENNAGNSAGAAAATTTAGGLKASKWKSVEVDASSSSSAAKDLAKSTTALLAQIGAAEVASRDEEMLDAEENLDGEPMLDSSDEEDNPGSSMNVDESVTAMDIDSVDPAKEGLALQNEPERERDDAQEEQNKDTTTPRRKPRMRAEDMFAESDGED